jgi:stearoyl-CoA desaturase (delta-9 desaturase)
MQFGFLYAHIGWVYSRHGSQTDYSNVRDLMRYPELIWLNRHTHLPFLTLFPIAYGVAGWSGVVVGVLWSTVALYHATFAINSLAHLWGTRRYFTGEESRNNALLALFTLGEGWHNNHHYYSVCARQGFFWWEVDPTYGVLRLLSLLGIVWDIKEPSEHVLRGERPLNRTQVRVAAETLLKHLNKGLPPEEESDQIERLAKHLIGASISLPEVIRATNSLKHRMHDEKTTSNL